MIDDIKEGLLESERIRLIQEQLCGFFLDEVITPGGEFYSDLSSVIVTGKSTEETSGKSTAKATGKSTEQAESTKQGSKRGKSSAKDQSSGRKKKLILNLANL